MIRHMPPRLTFCDPRGAATLNVSVRPPTVHEEETLVFILLLLLRIFTKQAGKCRTVAGRPGGFTTSLCCIAAACTVGLPAHRVVPNSSPTLARGVWFCCRRKTPCCQTQTSPVIEGRRARNSPRCSSVCVRLHLWVEWKNKGGLVRLYAPLLFFHLDAVPCFSAHIH